MIASRELQGAFNDAWLFAATNPECQPLEEQVFYSALQFRDAPDDAVVEYETTPRIAGPNEVLVDDLQSFEALLALVAGHYCKSPDWVNRVIKHEADHADESERRGLPLHRYGGKFLHDGPFDVSWTAFHVGYGGSGRLRKKDVAAIAVAPEPSSHDIKLINSLGYIDKSDVLSRL